MRQITVTEGLVELKTLDKRIYKAIESGAYVAVFMNKEKDGEKVSDFNDKAKAEYQSATDLIKERAKVKSAIVKSNALTTVVIGGKTMTVAEAIEKKSSIEYQKDLLNGLKRKFSEALYASDRTNRQVEANIDKLLEALVSSDKPVSAEDQRRTADMYMEANGCFVADPIGIQAEIDRLENEITTFEAEVDTVLSISNAITRITIE